MMFFKSFFTGTLLVWTASCCIASAQTLKGQNTTKPLLRSRALNPYDVDDDTGYYYGDDNYSYNDDYRCIDSPSNWHDSDGPEFNCSWYSIGNRCEEHGDGYAGVDGKTANEACCSFILNKLKVVVVAFCTVNLISAKSQSENIR